MEPQIILIVEDDRGQADALAGYLNAEGYTVEHKLHAADAIERISQYPPIALVITDVNLEEDDLGFTVASRSTLDGIPAIVLTGRDTEDKDRFMALGGGAVAYIKKPYDPIEIRMTVKNIAKVANRDTYKPIVELPPDYIYNNKERAIFRNGNPVTTLTPLQAKAFFAMATAMPGEIDKIALCKQLYGIYENGTANNLDTLMHRLRAVLSENNIQLSIRVISGSPTIYKLEPKTQDHD